MLSPPPKKKKRKKGVYLAISKLLLILAGANLLAHNNMSQFCYCGKISLQSDAFFSDNLTPLGVTFILLAMVPIHIYIISSIYILFLQ